MWLAPITLQGTHVTLEPLSTEHIPALQEAVQDGELWKLWYTSVPDPAGVEAYVKRALDGQQQGHMLPFAVRRNDNGRIVGCTRFYQIEAAHRHCAIGYTWYAASCQRTAVNTETKFLLLQYAFEHGQAIAVEFHTHFFNHRSRQAIQRLGAKQDGILRNHQILPDGSIRDTVVFSIIAGEWGVVRRNLLERLDGKA